MTEPTFDDLSDIYEAMIDWPKRLANEAPFYRGLFERHGVGRVLDTACGTGHHAEMFHSWGLQVQGADLSPVMIQRAKLRCGVSESLQWVVRGFDQPVAAGLFDAALCVGNSLALALETQVRRDAIQQMLASVRKGGVVILQVMNLWSIPEGICQWQKCKRASLPQGESLIIKGVHRSGPNGFVDLLVTDLASEKPGMRTDCVAFAGLEADALAEMAKQGGAVNVEIYGNYQRKPYVREQSQDLIVVISR